MRNPPRHFPDRPTTCDVSDLLNEIVRFVDENPMWAEDAESLAKMAVAYGILTNICTPDMVTEQEYEFVININTTLRESMNDA